MNRYNIHGRLLEAGYDWDEAEEITGTLAEEANDRERDRLIEEQYERAMHAQWLEAYDRFNKE